MYLGPRRTTLGIASDAGGDSLAEGEPGDDGLVEIIDEISQPSTSNIAIAIAAQMTRTFMLL